jgi:hypothetical protein
MAGTITITVRGGRSVRAGVLFLLGNVVVSSAVGFLIGLAGELVPVRASLFAIALVCLACLVSFVAFGRLPFVPWPPQLPSTWLDRRHPSRTALRYALVWGLTFATPIRAGSLLALAAVGLALHDPPLVAALFAVVGCIRALPASVTPLRVPIDAASTRKGAAGSWQRPLVGVLDAAAVAALFALASAALTT